MIPTSLQRRNRLTRLAGTGAAGALVLALAACGGSSEDTAGDGASGSASSSGVTGTVTVLAAASLTEALNTLAEDYEKANPGVQIELSFGSSSTLATQIAEGADADIAAFAGTKPLDLLPDGAVDAGGQETIARNVLEIATPTGNPGKVTGLADLAKSDLDVVLCASSVPCGSAADDVLKKANVTAHVVSREVDVKATLAKVELGEAEAAVVYHSDVVTAGDKVEGVEIPAEQNTTLDYPLVWLNKDAATVGFAQFVASAEGEKALTAAGFLPADA